MSRRREFPMPANIYGRIIKDGRNICHSQACDKEIKVGDMVRAVKKSGRCVNKKTVYYHLKCYEELLI